MTANAYTSFMPFGASGGGGLTLNTSSTSSTSGTGGGTNTGSSSGGPYFGNIDLGEPATVWSGATMLAGYLEAKQVLPVLPVVGRYLPGQFSIVTLGASVIFSGNKKRAGLIVGLSGIVGIGVGLFTANPVAGWAAASIISTALDAALPSDLFVKDPVVIDLDGDGIELVALTNSTAFFDMDADGFVENTA